MHPSRFGVACETWDGVVKFLVFVSFFYREMLIVSFLLMGFPFFLNHPPNLISPWCLLVKPCLDELLYKHLQEEEKM